MSRCLAKEKTAMKVLSQRDLPSKGIPWSREHTRRMVKSGQFPSPFKLTANGKNFWNETEIDAWLEKRAGAKLSSDTS
jgi:predicted DNA-binding transcriptional regulator AlpA